MKYNQALSGLYDYFIYNGEKINTRQFNDILLSIGLTSRATYSAYKREFIFMGILIQTDKRKYEIVPKKLAEYVQTEYKKLDRADIDSIIVYLSKYAGMHGSKKQFYELLHRISGATSKTCQTEIFNILYMQKYIDVDYDSNDYYITNKVKAPLNHKRNNKRNILTAIADIIQEVKDQIPIKIMAFKLWKRNIITSITNVRLLFQLLTG